jgi:hypothetical protein
MIVCVLFLPCLGGKINHFFINFFTLQKRKPDVQYAKLPSSLDWILLVCGIMYSCLLNDSSLFVSGTVCLSCCQCMMKSHLTIFNCKGNVLFGRTWIQNIKRTVSLTPLHDGCAIAQAVSGRLPTAAARFQAQAGWRGICGGQSCTGSGFLRVLRFPLPIIIPPTAPYSSSSIIRGWYSRPISGRRTKWTQSHPTQRN